MRLVTFSFGGRGAFASRFTPRSFDQAQQMADVAAKAGLVEVAHGSSVSLTEKGRQRGATLKAPKAD